MEKFKSDSIEELKLYSHIYDKLISHGITTISELINLSETDELYKKMNDCPKEYFDEISKKLNGFGLQLYGVDKLLPTQYDRVSYISETLRYPLRNSGIYKIRELIALTKKELKSLEGMTYRLSNETIKLIHSCGFKFADEIENPTSIEQKPIVVLGLEKRAFNALIRNGISFVSDITNASTKDLITMKGIAMKTSNEIIEKIHSLGLKFADEREEENSIVQNDIIDPINPPISEQMNESKLDKLARIQELQKQIIALQQEQSQLMQELQEELSKGDTNARQNK